MSVSVISGIIICLQLLPILNTPGLFFSLLRGETKSQKPMRGWTGEIASKLKTLAALTEDPSSVASIHVRQLIIASNCSSWASDTLF